MNPSHHSSSRNPFLRVYKAFLHTPLYGRTLAVLGFLALGIKQTMLFVSSHVLYQEPTLWATLGHYAAYLMSDFFVFFVLIGCVAINTLISQKARRMVTNLFALAILFFFVVDIVSLGTLQSGISIFDIGSGLFDPSVVKVTRSIFVIIIIAILLIMMVFVFAQTRFFRKRQKYYLIASIAIFALVGLLT
jgi:hypothetical protein